MCITKKPLVRSLFLTIVLGIPMQHIHADAVSDVTSKINALPTTQPATPEAAIKVWKDIANIASIATPSVTVPSATMDTLWTAIWNAYFIDNPSTSPALTISPEVNPEAYKAMFNALTALVAKSCTLISDVPTSDEGSNKAIVIGVLSSTGAVGSIMQTLVGATSSSTTGKAVSSTKTSSPTAKKNKKTGIKVSIPNPASRIQRIQQLR